MGWFKSKAEKIRELVELADEMTAKTGNSYEVVQDGDVLYASKRKTKEQPPRHVPTPEERKAAQEHSINVMRDIAIGNARIRNRKDLVKKLVAEAGIQKLVDAMTDEEVKAKLKELPSTSLPIKANFNAPVDLDGRIQVE